MRGLQPLKYGDGWPLVEACEALLAVDEMVERVATTLELQGRLDTTLFMLTADNGMAWGDHRWKAKQSAYATQIPMFVRWPDRQVPGAVVREWTTNVDLAPTLASIAGTDMGVLANGRGVDGIDIGVLFGGTGILDRDVILEERHAVDQGGSLPDAPGWWAIRTTTRHELGRWHYIEWADGFVELYDLRRDPHELVNLQASSAHRTAVSTLHAELEALKSDP